MLELSSFTVLPADDYIQRLLKVAVLVNPLVLMIDASDHNVDGRAGSFTVKDVVPVW